jgi:hypothetical protein
MRIVNIGLMSHPLNWLTLAVWLIGLAVIAHVIGVLPGNVLVMGASAPQQSRT